MPDQSASLESGADAPQSPARPERSELVVVVAATLVGLIVGVLLGLIPQDRFSAAALADASPGVTVSDALDVSPDVANRYVQTELVYIDIDQDKFDAAVAEAGLGQTAVITSRQVGATNIIEIRAADRTPDQAADIANIALDAYIEDWRARTLEESQRLLDNVTERIRTTRERIDALGGSPADVATRAGLTAELTRLTTEQSDLQYRIGGIEGANRAVQRANSALATRVSSVVQYAGLGALLGLLAGIGFVVLRRSRRQARIGAPT